VLDELRFCHKKENDYCDLLAAYTEENFVVKAKILRSILMGKINFSHQTFINSKYLL